MRVLNKYKDEIPADAIYIGRPSYWGNPYSIGRDGNREEVIEKYRAYLKTRPDITLKAKLELRGHDLVCFCAPAACHGDVLVEIANSDLLF